MMHEIAYKQVCRYFCFDKYCGFDLRKHLQNSSSGSEGCATTGNFCHKLSDPVCVQQGLVDSLETGYYLCAEMWMGGWKGSHSTELEGRSGKSESGSDSRRR